MCEFLQLETLSLKFTISKRGAFDNLSDQVLCSFFQYLSHIPRVDLEIDMASNDIAFCLHSLIKEEDDNTMDVEYTNFGTSESRALIHYQKQPMEINSICKIKIKIEVDDSKSNMTYIACLDTISAQIKALNFTLREYNNHKFDHKSGKFIMNENEKHLTLVHGSWLDHILETFKTLKDLDITYSILYYNLQNDKQQNFSIQQLKLQSVYIFDHRDNFFKRFSKCLPSLKHLLVLDCAFVDPAIMNKDPNDICARIREKTDALDRRGRFWQHFVEHYYIAHTY
jgi:hypothetical protein